MPAVITYLSIHHLNALSDMNQPNDIVATMPKPSWYVYKNIDNRRTTLEVTEEYKQYIGIEKWSDVIPNFRWKNLD